jgi:ribosome recycling factor
MDQLKRLEKDGHITEDDQKLYGDEIQELTDATIRDIDKSLAQKEQEILQV